MKENIIIKPMVPADIDDVVEILKKMPPTFWINTISRSKLARFLKKTMDSPRSVLLTAHPSAEKKVAGCIYSISHPKKFWLVFALKNPALMLHIGFHHLNRRLSLYEERKQLQSRKDDEPNLPFFSWDPSSPTKARIMFIYVQQEFRKIGIAVSMYQKLFDVLKKRGCSKVEEYVEPEYRAIAEKIVKACGWQIQQCKEGGYKLVRQL